MNATTADGHSWTPEVMVACGPRSASVERRTAERYFGQVVARGGYVFVGPLRESRKEAAQDVADWLEMHPWKS